MRNDIIITKKFIYAIYGLEYLVEAEYEEE